MNDEIILAKFDKILAQHEALRTTNRELSAENKALKARITRLLGPSSTTLNRRGLASNGVDPKRGYTKRVGQTVSNNSRNSVLRSEVEHETQERTPIGTTP